MHTNGTDMNPDNPDISVFDISYAFEKQHILTLRPTCATSIIATSNICLHSWQDETFITKSYILK